MTTEKLLAKREKNWPSDFPTLGPVSISLECGGTSPSFSDLHTGSALFFFSFSPAFSSPLPAVWKIFSQVNRLTGGVFLSPEMLFKVTAQVRTDRLLSLSRSGTSIQAPGSLGNTGRGTTAWEAPEDGLVGGCCTPTPIRSSQVGIIHWFSWDCKLPGRVGWLS